MSATPATPVTPTNSNTTISTESTANTANTANTQHTANTAPDGDAGSAPGAHAPIDGRVPHFPPSSATEDPASTHHGGRLILMRHGQTTSNVIQALDTAIPGADLTELGYEQAFMGGERLVTEEALTSDNPIIVSSEALRARRTAALAACGMATLGVAPFTVASGSKKVLSAHRQQAEQTVPTAIAGLSEVVAGDLEMHTERAALRTYHQTVHGWVRGTMETRMPGGQNGYETLSRLLGGLARVAAFLPEHDVIVVTHGTAMRFLAAQLAGVDPDFAEFSHVTNCRRIALSAPAGLTAADLAPSLGSWVVQEWAGLPGSAVPHRRA